MVVDMVRAGRMTALRKPDGVRGTVAGGVVRRLVARTVSQQLGPATMAATAPHQFASSTRSGCECVAHVLQGVTELNPGVTVTSIDGVRAYDMISRRAMMDGLRRVDGSCHLAVRENVLYGTPSVYLWRTLMAWCIPLSKGREGNRETP